MRRVWVWTAVCVIVIGGVGLAGELGGRFSSLIALEASPFHVDGFETILGIEYSESGWVFGAEAGFFDDEFDFVYFDAEGSLGAFEVYSVAGFDPLYGPFGPLFEYWNSVVSLSMGGVDLYAITLLSNHWYYDDSKKFWHDWPNEVGLGLRIGGWGTAGCVSVFGELQFNVDSSYDTDGPYWFWEYGFEEFVRSFIGQVYYGDWYGWTDWYWGDSEFTPYEPRCDLPFSGADFIVLAPFTCFDLYAGLGFTCSIGFEYLDLFVERIDLGIPWLELAYCGVWFETDLKEPYWALDLVVGEHVCLKPYLSLDDDYYSITGIVLNALTLEYEAAPGVTFKFGEKFTDDEWFDYVTWSEQWWTGWSAWGEIAAWHDNLWEYGWDGIWSYDDDEYIALEIAGDACCGRPFEAFIYNWFDTEQVGVFMDWDQTIAGMLLGIAPNTTLAFTIYVSPGGLDYLVFGTELAW